jgi:hypothetical protein
MEGILCVNRTNDSAAPIEAGEEMGEMAMDDYSTFVSRQQEICRFNKK